MKLSNSPAFVPIVGSAARLVFGVVGRQYRLVDQSTDLVRQEQEDGSRFQS